MKHRFFEMTFVTLAPIRRAALALALILAVGQVRAAMDFSGDLAPGNWTLSQPLGSVAFNSANTQLMIIGPSGLGSAASATEMAVCSGPGGLGLSVAGTLTFTWSFNSGDALSAEADFGSLSGGSVMLASGGPGTVSQGTYSVALMQGDQFAFLLSTQDPALKRDPGELLIEDVIFVAVPEVSTVWCGAGLLGLLALCNARRRAGTNS